jgi:sortase A
MGKRSDRRKFRRRRRWAAFFVLLSLALVVSGVMFLTRMGTAENLPAATGGVERAASVRVAQAPEAASGQEKNEVDKEAAQEPDPKKRSATPTPPTNDLWISIPALGLYDVYVTNTSDPREGHAGPETPLDYGLIKLAHTDYPWQPNANTYIVGHRLGWPGTGSYHIFYNLPLLANGDVIYLGDANGTTYTYEVTEFHEITPDETWVTTPKPGRDMVSLQTCIENFGDYWTMGPNWYVRYIVQADRVSVDVAK